MLSSRRLKYGTTGVTVVNEGGLIVRYGVLEPLKVSVT